MAQLSENERKDLWAALMAQASSRCEELGLTKQDLRDAVDAVDDWIEDNMASFNSAIPQTARTALTAQQKVQLLLCVIKKRWEVS